MQTLELLDIIQFFSKFIWVLFTFSLCAVLNGLYIKLEPKAPLENGTKYENSASDAAKVNMQEYLLCRRCIRG